jgi:hypothetical protein
MENIELLLLDEATKAAVLLTDANYRRFVSVRTDILEVQGNVVTVRVEQSRKMTDMVFEPKELIEKAKEVLSHIPEGRFTYRFRPLTFKGEGLEMVSGDWVKRRMAERSMSQEEIAAAMGTDKFVISKLLGGKTGFTTAWKAAFWYYFNPNVV